ncbi:hypothetical protein BJX63DRAFT_27038 [Aspergillus granulosus]|uniref:Uncharacterized protein n=1 Tax=Aspergillus granulosus TaxID=176169 RepID=A0ABR4GZI2_9EURO
MEEQIQTAIEYCSGSWTRKSRPCLHHVQPRQGLHSKSDRLLLLSSRFGCWKLRSPLTMGFRGFSDQSFCLQTPVHLKFRGIESPGRWIPLTKEYVGPWSQGATISGDFPTLISACLSRPSSAGQSFHLHFFLPASSSQFCISFVHFDSKLFPSLARCTSAHSAHSFLSYLFSQAFILLATNHYPSLTLVQLDA